MDHVKHWCKTLHKADAITIAIPFCGRSRTLGRLIDWLEGQTVPHSYCRLLFYDNSLDVRFGRRLRQWLSTCDYGSYTYYPCHLAATPSMTNEQTADEDRSQHALAVNHRVAGNWNKIAQLVQTDLVLCLEDDIIPPRNALDRLLAAMRNDVAAVSAIYAGRKDRWVVKDFASLNPLRPTEKWVLGGIEVCGAPGMGCVLVRKEVLQSVPMRSAGEGAGHPWYDWNFWADVARQPDLGKVKIDGDLVCEHLMETVHAVQ